MPILNSSNLPNWQANDHSPTPNLNSFISIIFKLLRASLVGYYIYSSTYHLDTLIFSETLTFLSFNGIILYIPNISYSFYLIMFWIWIRVCSNFEGICLCNSLIDYWFCFIIFKIISYISPTFPSSSLSPVSTVSSSFYFKCFTI